MNILRFKVGLTLLIMTFISSFLLSSCEFKDVDESSQKQASPIDVPVIAKLGGEWVVIAEGTGKKGEKNASSWYLFRFHPDRTAKLIWVTPGHYARETVHYSEDGKTVTFKDASEAPQVNGVPFTVGDDGFMTGSIPGLGGGENLKFTHRSTGWPYLHWAFVFIGLAVTFLMWRQWKWFTPIVMGAGIVILTFYWINNSGVTAMFRWVKLYTLVVSVWFFWIVRFTPLHKYRWMRFLVAAILVVNICEAVEVDFRSGYIPNILNGAAGILNILAITRWNGLGPNRRPVRDLIWPGQAVLWIIAYDIWNVSFSYFNFNEYTSNSIALNLVPTLLALWIPGIWVSARGTTLGFFYIYLFSFSSFVMEKSFVPIPINQTAAMTVGVISFGVNLVLCALVWRWKIFQKGPVWPNFGQYRHAEPIIGLDDSIHVDLDKIPAMADYPPGVLEKAQEEEAERNAAGGSAFRRRAHERLE